MGPLRVYILSKLVALLPNLKRLIVEFTDITDDVSDNRRKSP